jgi:hypothetical protein
MIPKVSTVLMVARLRRTCGTRPHDYEFEFVQTQHGAKYNLGCIIPLVA